MSPKELLPTARGGRLTFDNDGEVFYLSFSLSLVLAIFLLSSAPMVSTSRNRYVRRLGARGSTILRATVTCGDTIFGGFHVPGGFDAASGYPQDLVDNVLCRPTFGVLAKFQILSCRLMFGMSAKFYVLIDTHADIKR
jgi:hypothetical protein